ncbi:MAG: hypothetical protein ACR2RE_09085 [Geminicoccaceae bacterium]
MTETPEEIISKQLIYAFDRSDCTGADIIAVLDAAGYVIVQKEPTDEMRRVAARYLGFSPDEPRGLAEATRISMWQAMITAAQNEESRQPEG